MKLSDNVVVSNIDGENQFLIELITPVDMRITLEYSHVSFSSKKKRRSKKDPNELLMERHGKLYIAPILINDSDKKIYFRLKDSANKIIVLDSMQEFEFIPEEVSEDFGTFSEEEINLAMETACETDNVVAVPETMALMPMNDRDLIHPRRGLRFSYKLNKKIRLIIYKLFRRLPNFITGNYRRRINL